MWLLLEISLLQNKTYFIKYNIKLIKYAQKVSFIFSFLNFRINNWSIYTSDNMAFFKLEAQFKPGFLQEQLLSLLFPLITATYHFE